MPKCMKCGGEAGGGNFCKNCGAPIYKTAETPEKCPKCGAETGGGSFCKNCGVPLGSANIAPMSAEAQHGAAEKAAVSQSAAAEQNSEKGGCSLFIIIVLFIVMGIAKMMCGKPDDPKTIAENNAKNAAIQIVQEFILEYPETATFTELEIVDKDKYHKYMVTMRVKTQNVFGAKIVRRFAVIVELAKDEFFYHYGANSVYEYTGGDIQAMNRMSEIKFFKARNKWGEDLDRGEDLKKQEEDAKK